MSAPETSVRVEDLLAHGPWVRTLARALTRDENEAEDVQQQTWLVALLSPPRRDTSLRGWLGTVARNVARTRARRSEVRERHADAVARSTKPGTQDPAELTARAELHAAVATAVVALEEPYRRAILLRHFEDLPVVDVARALGVPLETARARLRRGRAKLRERLARDLGEESGDGRALAIVLAPLLTERPMLTGGLTVGAVTGGTLMTGKLVAATMAVAALLALAWWYTDGAREAGSHGTEVSEASPALATTARETISVKPATGRRRSPSEDAANAVAVAGPAEEPETDGRPRNAGPVEPERAPKAGADEPSAAARLARPIEELVFDNAPIREVLGRISWHAKVPIDVDVRAVAALDTATSAVNGQDAEGLTMLRLTSMMAGLEIEVLSDRVILRRAEDEWAEGGPVQRIDPNPPPKDPELVRFTGKVLDQAGMPVAGARISGLTGDIVRTGPDGGFSAQVVAEAHEVVARAEGHVPSAPLDLRPPFHATESLDIVLGPPAARVTVVVTGAENRPVPQALVRLLEVDGSIDVLHTNAEGAATFGESRSGVYTLSVTAHGHAPVTRTIRAVAGTGTKLAVELVPRTLAQRLRSQRTTVAFHGESLSQVVASLYRHWEVTVRMGRHVPYETTSRPVDLQIEDDSLDNALRAICACAGATYVLDEEREIVWIEVPR